MIELKNVSKNYGKRQAVRDVSLTIGSGEIGRASCRERV